MQQIAATPEYGSPLGEPVDLVDKVLVDMVLVEAEAEPAEDDEGDEAVEAPVLESRAASDVDEDEDVGDEKEEDDGTPGDEEDEVQGLELVLLGRVQLLIFGSKVC